MAIMARRSKSRRTHLLGACATCRRRHVKCDQQRPACKTCHATGYVCEGFSNEVRWMSDLDQSAHREKAREKGNHLKRNGLRRYLYSEESRVSMGVVLNKDLFSGSIDATIGEIDARSQETPSSPINDIRIGPFAVLNLKNTVQESQEFTTAHTIPRHITEPHAPFTYNIVQAAQLVEESSLLPTEPPELADDIFQWSDIFGLNDDFYGITSDFSLDLANYPDLLTPPDWLTTYDDATYNTSSPTVHDPTPEIPQIPSLQSDSKSMQAHENLPDNSKSTREILSDAPYLLQVFQKHVVPQLTIVPFGKKASWSILNVPAALVTLGDLTILESQDVSHARQANLYSLLACAAIFLAMSPSTDSNDTKETGNWQSFASKAYSDAKDHTIMFMKEPIGPRKAKYKDRIMAICGMMEAANFYGQQQDSRYFTLEAERLLRRRATCKPKTSHKTRLLVNVYTWLRIVGESTYVLQDFGASKLFTDALDRQIHACRPDNLNGRVQSTRDQNIHDDDFLHMEHSDNDLDINSPKDARKDIPDIHLHDSRKSAATLAKQVYGISETWLSLLSQTTRLANVMEKVRAAQNSDIQINSNVSKFLQERSDRLESVIHSYVSQNDEPESPEGYADPYIHVSRAFNASLVIFFYRRVRKVHPGILGSQVDTVIQSLQALHTELQTVEHTGPGTIWPVFIAGCEAMTNEKRTAILNLLEKSESKCRLPPFQAARCIMTGLWARYDEQVGAERREPFYSWMDALKELKAWPIFC